MNRFIVVACLFLPVPAWAQLAPNRVDVVQQVAAQHSTDFANCHRPELGEAAYTFIRRLAWELHKRDPRFGLNGKRGTDELSFDAISFRNPAVPGGVEVIDVVAGAGGPNPAPTWNNVTAFGIGKFIPPSAVGHRGRMTAPDESAVIRALAREIGIHDDAREFVAAAAIRLSLKDPRWGLKSTLSGDISEHTLGYRVDAWGRVIAVRIVGGDDGLPPGWAWKDYGEVSGKWYPAHGRFKHPR